jgi:hypothetical protein
MVPVDVTLGHAVNAVRERLVWKCISHHSSFVVCAADVLHHCAASTLLLGRVGVFAFVDLVKRVLVYVGAICSRDMKNLLFPIGWAP